MTAGSVKAKLSSVSVLKCNKVKVETRISSFLNVILIATFRITRLSGFQVDFYLSSRQCNIEDFTHKEISLNLFAFICTFYHTPYHKKIIRDWTGCHG